MLKPNQRRPGEITNKIVVVAMTVFSLLMKMSSLSKTTLKMVQFNGTEILHLKIWHI